MPVPPVCVWASPFRLLGGRVEWRGGACVVMSVFGLGLASCIVLLPFALSCPSLCLLSQHCWFRCVIVE